MVAMQPPPTPEPPRIPDTPAPAAGPAWAGAAPARFGLADLQVHSAHGDGMADAAQLLRHVELHTDLDLIAVTDHDDIAGALLARDVHARGRYRFEFVPGIEVTTRQGHLLALWVDRPIPSLRALPETVEAIHRAGGVAVVPHPFSAWTRSVGQRALERVLRIDDPAAHPDGIEVANLTLAGRAHAGRARRLNRGYRLAETGGSDAHFPEAIGSAATRFPGHTAADLRRAIAERTTAGVARRHPGLGEIGWGRLAQQQVRGLAVTPRKLIARSPLGRVSRRTPREGHA